MALLHQSGNGQWMGPLDRQCDQRQITLDCKKTISASPNRRERPLLSKTGWGTTERKRETYGQKEREIGREEAVLYEKEDKSMMDADHVELHAKCVAI